MRDNMIETAEMRHWASIKALKRALKELSATKGGEYWSHNDVYIIGWRDSGKYDGFDTTGIDTFITFQHAETGNYYHLAIQLKSSKAKMDEHNAREKQDIPCVANDSGLPPLKEQLKDIAIRYINSLFLGDEKEINSKDKKAQKLLDWLKKYWKNEFVSLPDIYRSGPRQTRRRDDAKRAVSILIEQKWLAPLNNVVIIKGKPRREVYRVNYERFSDVYSSYYLQASDKPHNPHQCRNQSI